MVTNRENWRPSGPSSIAVPATRRPLGGALEAGASSTMTVCGTAKGGIVSVAGLLPFPMVNATPAGPVTWLSPQDVNERALAATQKRTRARRERGNSGV